jgi:hypothetical protein
MTAPATCPSELAVAVAVARLEARMDALDKAEAVRAAETARRLEALNHSHERDEQAQRSYLPREVFEKTAQDTVLWRESVNKALGLCLRQDVFNTTLAEWQKWRNEVDQNRAEAAGRRAVIAAIVVGGVSFIGMIINTVARLHGG